MWESVFDLLEEERKRQQELGREDNHSWATWSLIHSKYAGKVSDLILKFAYGEKTEKDIEEMQQALVEVTSIGVAWLENLLEFIDSTTEYTDGQQSEEKG